MRLYQVYIFSCIFRTQQRLVELARTWCKTLATLREFAFARFARTAGSFMHTRISSYLMILRIVCYILQSSTYRIPRTLGPCAAYSCAAAAAAVAAVRSRGGLLCG